MSLCKYKDALGKPGKGIHAHIFGIAIVDVVMTLLLALLITHIMKWQFWTVLLCLLLITILLHRLFCVNTVINKAIFGKV